ncbi:MAG TPA: hypothetical protein VGF14_08265, partial [Alphaproteobacteria bacterium]
TMPTDGQVKVVQDEMEARFLDKCAFQAQQSTDASVSYGQKNKDLFTRIKWLCRDENARNAFHSTLDDISGRVEAHVKKPEHVTILFQTALETVCRRNDEGGTHVWNWLKMAPVQPEQIESLCDSQFKSPDYMRSAGTILSQLYHILPDAEELWDKSNTRRDNYTAALKPQIMLLTGDYKI